MERKKDESTSVAQIRQAFSVIEDGALANRLQSQEISEHYSGNRMRNSQIRSDFPKAILEQRVEVLEASRELFKRRQSSFKDAEIARNLFLRENSEEQRNYETKRQQVFEQRLAREIICRTPPLLVNENGDIFSVFDEDEENDEESTFSKGYNDEEYRLTLAVPALVKAEPVYANNRPEHYAVSSQYPLSIESGNSYEFSGSLDLASATGYLSQADIACSQRAERIFEQQKLDEEYAKKLQAELEVSNKYEEEKDFELAKQIYERDKAKIKRAKERSKAKKLAAAAAAATTKVTASTSTGVSEAIVDSSSCPSHQKEGSCCQWESPHYENVEFKKIHSVLDDIPIPPYMPMQASVSKKTTSMEKKLNKRKEKEGCKQQ